jgi:type IV pilus assembly protein PilW
MDELTSPKGQVTHHNQRGLSLIELMISMVIGLITILALTQVAVNFERQKRTTVGAGDTSDAANVALQLMRNSLMSAGHGINFANASGCPLTVYREADDSTLTLTTANASLPGLYPVFITQGAGTASDILTIAAGSSRRFAETGLFSGHIGDASNFVTDSNFGFQTGDVVLITETLGGPCALRQLSANLTTLSPPNTTNFQHQSGTSNTRYNDPAGVGTAFTSAAKVTNLGRTPTITQFGVVNNNFQRIDLLNNTTNNLFENALTLQVQYGFRNATGGTDWCDLIGGTGCTTITNDAAGWMRLNVVRLALILRNSQFENQNRDADSNCTTSAETLTWSWGSFSLTGITNARCYRYQVVETIVPLKNIIWSL